LVAKWESNFNMTDTQETQKEITLRLKWSREIDLPTIYANHVYISHMGPEFILIFGEAEIPIMVDPSPEELEEIGEVAIKPVVRLAIAPDAMLRIASVIQGNVQKYLDKQAGQEEDRDV
jgi:hypothetical protein